MPRPNPTEVQSAFSGLPSDSYEFIVRSAKAKAFNKTLDDGSEKSSTCITYGLEVADGPHKGKPAQFNYWTHSEGGLKMGKPFLLACAGFKNDKEGEGNYNSTHGSPEGWDYDTESGQVGEFWAEPIAKRIHADVTLKVGDNGMENNDFKKWRSV